MLHIFKNYLELDSYPTIPETYLENSLLKDPTSQMSKFFRQREMTANYKKKKIKVGKKFPIPTLYRDVEVMNEEMQLEPCGFSMHMRKDLDLYEEVVSKTAQSNGPGSDKLNSKKATPGSAINGLVNGSEVKINQGVIDEKLKDELINLKEIFELGLISEENYEQAKKRILFLSENSLTKEV